MMTENEAVLRPGLGWLLIRSAWVCAALIAFSLPGWIVGVSWVPFWLVLLVGGGVFGLRWFLSKAGYDDPGLWPVLSSSLMSVLVCLPVGMVLFWISRGSIYMYGGSTWLVVLGGMGCCFTVCQACFMNRFAWKLTQDKAKAWSYRMLLVLGGLVVLSAAALVAAIVMVNNCCGA